MKAVLAAQKLKLRAQELREAAGSQASSVKSESDIYRRAAFMVTAKELDVSLSASMELEPMYISFERMGLKDSEPTVHDTGTSEGDEGGVYIWHKVAISADMPSLTNPDDEEGGPFLFPAIESGHAETDPQTGLPAYATLKIVVHDDDEEPILIGHLPLVEEETHHPTRGVHSVEMHKFDDPGHTAATLKLELVDEVDVADLQEEIKEEEEEEEDLGEYASEDPWVAGRPQTLPTTPFQPGDGFDLYIDGARFLPDNCTISKVSVKAFTSDKQLVGDDDIIAVPHPNDPMYCPMYELRHEYRLDRFNPTTTILVRIDTIEVHTHSLMAVGYAVLPCFKKKDGKLVTKSNEQEFVLNDGSFQIPVHQMPPALKGINGNSLDNTPRVPCCSLLIRIHAAPKATDGLSVLSTSDSKIAEADYVSLGLMVPYEDYSTGCYDSSKSEPTELENKFFKFRAERIDPHVSGALELAHDGSDDEPPPDVSNVEEAEEEILGWIAKRVDGKPRAMLDFTYINKYQPSDGFKVAVDTAYNMPPPGTFKSAPLYKVVYSLSPPGLFYREPAMTEDTQFTKDVDVDSPQLRPNFTDGYHLFKDVPFEANTTLLMEVQRIKIDKKGVVTDVSVDGWAALPVFRDDEYVDTGGYQVPVIGGEVPKTVLEQENVYEWICKELKKKPKDASISLIEGASVFVRLIDPNIENMLEKPRQPKEIDDNYLTTTLQAAGKTADQHKWANDPEGDAKDARKKPVSKLLPGKKDPDDVLLEINRAFAERTNITHYGL